MTSPQRQPLLHDLAVTLAAPTVVLSAPDGNLDATAPGAGVQGLFHADVRAVSLLRVTLRPVGAPSGEHAEKAPSAVGEGVGGGGGEGWLPVVGGLLERVEEGRQPQRRQGAREGRR
ncbi:glycogen debranching N-terminal domain-containing protein, partial [Streptomyces bottropensis]|uniref:glycogen debranching N-terminal domain-containing protein n=1 Tax=Streptomyces bottropensis TaxID=42235 RepID=UPI0036B499AD